MKLFRYELKKLQCQHIFWIIVVLCISFNGVLLAFQANRESIAPKMEKEEIEDFELVSDYQDYLDQIQKDAKKMAQVSIFRDKAAFSTRNIEKTARDFGHLYHIQPQPGYSKGIKTAVSQEGTDYIMVLLLIALCISLWAEEKQSGLLKLIAPTEKGRHHTLAAKLAVMAFFAVLLVVTLYGQNFVFAGLRYGFGELLRPIQSIGAYWTCALGISLRSFFLLFFGIKLIYCLMLGTLFSAICIWTTTMLQTILADILLLGVNAALFFGVKENSLVMAFKYLNLYYPLHTDRFLTVYKNVNLFGYPVNVLNISIGLLLVLVVFFLWLSARMLFGVSYLRENGFVRKKRSFRIRQHAGGLLHFEYLKLVRKNGVIWILVFFSLIQICRTYSYQFFQQTDEIYVKKYMDYLSGPVTESVKSYVEEENARYAELYEKLDATEDLREQSRIRQELLPAEAWLRVNKEYERILASERTGNAELCIVYPEGYCQIMGENDKRDLTKAAVLCVLFCICLAGIFSQDAGCGMDHLIFSTPGGRKDSVRAKNRISFLTAFFLFILVYGADFLMIQLKIGMQQWQAPIQSLGIFDDYPSGLRLWQYIALLYFVRFAGMWACLCVIRILSFLCRSVFRTVLLSAIILILPALLGLSGLRVIDYISLVPLLTGNGIMHHLISGQGILYGAVMLLTAPGLILISKLFFAKHIKE